MSFHVGQKVVCVRPEGNRRVKRNAIYTVTGFGVLPMSGKPGLYLAETGTESGLPFYEDRFRPLIERSTKTGMAILLKIAEDAAKRRELTVHD